MRIHNFNQKGISITEVLLVSTVSITIMMGIISMFNQLYRGMSLAESKYTFMSLRDSFKALLLDDNVWYNTVNASINTSLDCLKNNATNVANGFDCSANMNIDNPILEIHGGDSANSYVAYQVGPSTGGKFFGFKKTGEPCPDFDPTNGDVACPIRVEVTWKPLCLVATNCKGPMTEVSAKFHYNTGNVQSSNINVKVFNFSIKRPGKSVTPEDTCASLGGVFNSTTKQCSIDATITDVACSTAGGTMVNGNCQLPDNLTQNQCSSLGGTWNGTTCTLSTDQAVIDTCAALGGTINAGTCSLSSELSGVGSCGANQYMKGFDSSGNPICADGSVSMADSCTGNQIMKGLNGYGLPNCVDPIPPSVSCPSGQVLTGISSLGAPVCITPSSTAPAISCPAGKYLTGISSTGSPICNNLTLTQSSCTWTSFFRAESSNSPQYAPTGAYIAAVDYQASTGGNDGQIRFLYCYP